MQNIKAHIALCRKYKEEGKLDKALSGLKKALVLSHGENLLLSEVYHELAQVYMMQEKFDTAIKSFRLSLSLSSDNIYTYMLLHKALRKAGLYKEALKELLIVFERTENGSALKEETCGELIYLSQECRNSGASPVEKFEIFSSLLSNPSIPDKLKNDIYLEFINLLQDQNKAGNFPKVLEETKKAARLIPEKNSMIYNAVVNEMEIAGKNTVLSSRVRNLTVVLTQKCNLDCIMCAQDHKEKNDISEKVIDEIKNALPYLEQITWCGGEVLLCEKFDHIFNEACKYPVKQEIITNGTLLTEDLVKKYFNNNVVLNISIDGVTRNVYEKIRRGASFDVLVEKLEMIKKIYKGPNYNYHMLSVVMNSNYRQMDKFAGFAKKYGFTGLGINFLICGKDKDKKEDIWFENRTTPVMKQVSKANKELFNQCKEYKIGFSSNITDDLVKMKNNADTKNIIMPGERSVYPEKKNELTGCCLAPWKRLTISMNGEAFPYAHSLCDNVVGNLNNCTLDELWNGKKMVDYRKDIIAGKYTDFCAQFKSCGRIDF
jgi:MoaA/NifB/PqqE/SkfB family radical SAM enzyme